MVDKIDNDLWILFSKKVVNELFDELIYKKMYKKIYKKTRYCD